MRLPKRSRRHCLCHRTCVSAGALFLYRSPSAANNDDSTYCTRLSNYPWRQLLQSTSSMPLQQRLQSTTCPACLCHRVSTGTLLVCRSPSANDPFQAADRRSHPITASSAANHRATATRPITASQSASSTVAPDRLLAHVHLAHSAARAEACPMVL